MAKCKNILALAAGALIVFGFSAKDAQAQTSIYSCSGSYFDTYSQTYDACGANNTANSASTVVTSTAVLKTATRQASGLISNRLSSALSGGSGFSVASNGFSVSTDDLSGVAAGNGGSKVAAWVGGSFSSVEDENFDTEFDGEVYSGFVGVDYRVTPRTIVGLSVGYEDTDIDTPFNARSGVTGAAAVAGTNEGSLESDGYTVAVYVGSELAENVTGTLTLGYSDLDYDTVRFDPVTAERLSGSTESDRYFIAGAVEGRHALHDNWSLRGKGSIFFASEDKDAFTETGSLGNSVAQGSNDTDFGQVSLDARVGYTMTHVEPYALVGLDFDYTKDEASVGAGQSEASLDDEDFGARFGAGLDLHLAPNVSGGIEAYTVEFRDDYEEYTVTGGLRVHF